MIPPAPSPVARRELDDREMGELLDETGILQMQTLLEVDRLLGEIQASYVKIIGLLDELKSSR